MNEWFEEMKPSKIRKHQQREMGMHTDESERVAKLELKLGSIKKRKEGSPAERNYGSGKPRKEASI